MDSAPEPQPLKCDAQLDQRHVNLPMKQMDEAGDGDYSKSVYEDTWEDLGVLCETWKALHGVDSFFCQAALRDYANHLEEEDS